MQSYIDPQSVAWNRSQYHYSLCDPRTAAQYYPSCARSFSAFTAHVQPTDTILRNIDTERIDDQTLVKLFFELGLHKMRYLPDLRTITGEMF